MALWLGAHLAGSCLLWLVASALAPSYVRVSFLRTFAAAVIMGGLAVLSLYVLNPQLGGWRLLIEFFVDAFVIQAVIGLPFARSFMTAIIYWAVLLVAVYFILLRTGNYRTASWSVPLSKTLATRA